MNGTVLNPHSLRADFPILAQEVHGKPLAYLDSAASSQRPVQVVEAMERFYRAKYANIHRGVYTLSEEATAAYEEARGKVAAFINAPTPRSLVFTRNTTEAINLVAYSWGRANIGAGDRIISTEMEHHSNLVPWQMLAQQVGAELVFVPITAEGHLNLDALDDLLQENVKLVAFTHVSNVLGTINPVAEIIARVRRAAPQAKVLVDTAQGAPHLPVDVTAWDCDFLAFSGHKMCGPTGIGVLYGRKELLDDMPPFLTGGGMIRRVELTHSTWDEVPARFEAGTPAIVEAVGLGAAVDYLTAVGMEAIAAHERKLTAYGMERLTAIKGVRLVGPPADDHCGLLSFVADRVHPHDMAQILDWEGVAVRAGHHCAQPLHRKLGLSATTRASFYLYTTEDEIERLAVGVEKAVQRFSR